MSSKDDRSMVWSTMSNAFPESINTSTHCLFLFKISYILLVKQLISSCVDIFELKPFCETDNIFFLIFARLDIKGY